MTPNEFLQNAKERVYSQLNDLKNARSYTYDFDPKSEQFKSAKKELKKVLLTVANEALSAFQTYGDSVTFGVRVPMADLLGFLQDVHRDDPHEILRDRRETPRAINAEIWFECCGLESGVGKQFVVEITRRFDDKDGEYTWKVYSRNIDKLIIRKAKYGEVNGVGNSVLETLKQTIQSQIN